MGIFMFKEIVDIQYHNFNPTNFVKAYFSTVMDELHGEAPYGSNLHATITAHENYLKGVVQITSPKGKFFAVATDSNKHQLARKLVQQIRKQLNRWKDKRFKGRQAVRDFEKHFNDGVA